MSTDIAFRKFRRWFSSFFSHWPIARTGRKRKSRTCTQMRVVFPYWTDWYVVNISLLSSFFFWLDNYAHPSFTCSCPKYFTRIHRHQETEMVLWNPALSSGQDSSVCCIIVAIILIIEQMIVLVVMRGMEKSYQNFSPCTELVNFPLKRKKRASEFSFLIRLNELVNFLRRFLMKQIPSLETVFHIEWYILSENSENLSKVFNEVLQQDKRSWAPQFCRVHWSPMVKYTNLITNAVLTEYMESMKVWAIILTLELSEPLNA